MYEPWAYTEKILTLLANRNDGKNEYIVIPILGMEKVDVMFYKDKYKKENLTDNFERAFVWKHYNLAVKSQIQCKSSYILRRPHNFAKSSSYFWLQSKLTGRFRKILWPSQNIWTLLLTYWWHLKDETTNSPIPEFKLLQNVF